MLISGFLIVAASATEPAVDIPSELLRLAAPSGPVVLRGAAPPRPSYRRPVTGNSSVDATELGQSALLDLAYMGLSEGMCLAHPPQGLKLCWTAALARGDFQEAFGYQSQVAVAEPLAVETILLEWSAANVTWGTHEAENHLDHAFCLASTGSAWLEQQRDPNGIREDVALWLAHSAVSRHLEHLSTGSSQAAQTAEKQYLQALALMDSQEFPLSPSITEALETLAPAPREHEDLNQIDCALVLGQSGWDHFSESLAGFSRHR